MLSLWNLSRLLLRPQAWFCLAAVAAGGLLWGQTLRLHHLQGQLAAARLALVDPRTQQSWREEAAAFERGWRECRVGADSLERAIDQQNAAVAALQEQGERRRAQAEQAQAQAAAARRRAQDAAPAVLAAPPEADHCAAALKLIRIR